ncbi:MAG: hypothetical protein KJ935_06795 [Candidatus Omnitrophica bacterium]|nr:hypothetical protein [Candidatus Omnitrophota bacterium]
MAQTDLETLVEYLRRRTARTHVGLWLMPLNRIGHEAEIAVRLGVQALDIGNYLHGKLPTGADFVRLSAQKVIETLDDVASSIGQSDCVLVYNLDLLLSGIKDEERQQIWLDLFNRFPGRARVLLIAVPDTATHLLPSESLHKKWQDDSRLA